MAKQSLYSILALFSSLIVGFLIYFGITRHYKLQDIIAAGDSTRTLANLVSLSLLFSIIAIAVSVSIASFGIGIYADTKEVIDSYGK